MRIRDTASVLLIAAPVVLGLARVQAAPSPAALGGPMTVHEWGTFTNFSTSDGVQHPFPSNVGQAAGLPAFTYGFTGGDNTQAHVSGLKESLTCTQRMETPVIYFYPGCVETVSVEARILDGQMTEFYPPLNGLDGLGGHAGKADHSVVRWNDVTFDRESRGAAGLPSDESKSHYYAARGTDAAPVVVSGLGAMHHEKFLFYRGGANFTSRLAVRALGRDRFEMTNSTGADVPAAFVVSIARNANAGADAKPVVRWSRVGVVGATGTFTLGADAGSLDGLATAMRESLVRAGLYEKEAHAMIETWRAYWFDEEGTRVLAIMPRKEVDRVVPLTITPAPEAMERVFVARMDVTTPEVEARLVSYLGQPESARPDRATLPRLGRFLEPALKAMKERAARAAK